MSTHDDLFETGSLPVLMSHFGDSGRVQYIPRGGVPVSVTAIIGNEEAIEVDHASGRRRVLRRTISITRDSAGQFGGVDQPALNAAVKVDTLVYAIASIKPLGRDAFDVVATRNEQMEVSRADYRNPAYGNVSR
jgi:hypothetical protein